jgi:transcriptional regulator with XRE-family HTH domain
MWNVCSIKLENMGMLWYISTWVMALNRIKKLRKERGMTQAELARELDISASSIGMYEQGRREPDKEMFLRLSRYFGVPVEYLMDDSVQLDEPMEVKDFIEKVRRELLEREGLLVNGVPLSRSDIEEIMQAIEKSALTATTKYSK